MGQWGPGTPARAPTPTGVRMKVTMRTDMVDRGLYYHRGREYDLDEKTARALIRTHQAFPIQENETAAMQPAENASRDRRR